MAKKYNLATNQATINDVMKKLFLFLLLIQPFLTVAQIVSENSVEERIKISNKADLDHIKGLVCAFMNTDGAEQINDLEFRGKTKTVYFRKEEAKYKTYHNYSVKFSFEHNKLVALYSINGIDGDKTVCDLSQATLPVDLPSDSYLAQAKDYCSKQAARLGDFIKSNGNKYSKDTNRIPYYFNLDYIIDNRSISYYKVIRSEKDLKKEELFRIVDNYFAFAYRDGKSVIQNRDLENNSILGKGFYGKTHKYRNDFVGVEEIYDIPHMVRIDCRDGRIRVTITISEYEILRFGKSKFVDSSNYTRNPLDYTPFGKDRDEEMEECLTKLENRIINQFSEIKSAIDKGLTPVDNLDNW